MASFSPFWAIHYKDIGFCCVLWPLQSNQVFEGNKIIEFIDTDWMDGKKLKWIGWDKQGYYAWIDSDGTLYNFSDLKRNDTGKEYESTKERIRIPNDGNPDNSQAAISGNFYEYELGILKRCGFCPGPAGPSEPDDSESSTDTGGSKKADDKDNAVTLAWQGLAQGNIPDYAGIYGGKNVATDSSDATYSGYVTAANIYGASYGAGGGGGSKNEAIPKLPYSGPVPLPTGVPTPQPMPYVPLPGFPKNPVARTDGVTKSVVSQKAKTNPFKDIPINLPKPAIDKLRTGLPLIPNIPKIPNQNPYKPIGAVGAYKPTPTYDPKPKPPTKETKKEKEESDFQKALETLLEIAATGNKKIEKLNNGFTAAKLGYDVGQIARAADKFETAVISGNKAAADRYEQELAEAKKNFIDDAKDVAIGVVFSQPVLAAQSMNLLRILSETSREYLATRILQIMKDLKNPNVTLSKRKELSTEYQRLLTKFLKSFK